MFKLILNTSCTPPQKNLNIIEFLIALIPCFYIIIMPDDKCYCTVLCYKWKHFIKSLDIMQDESSCYDYQLLSIFKF